MVLHAPAFSFFVQAFAGSIKFHAAVREQSRNVFGKLRAAVDNVVKGIFVHAIALNV